ncbi:MAG: HD domain-containing protein [Candidatus Omnitrophota bacterium]
MFGLKNEDKILLAQILRFAKIRKTKLYIVGGYLRDLFLNREKSSPDIDFCLKKNAINFGRLLSKEIRAGFVVLDKEHGACRLVKRFRDKIYTLDFTDFRGKSLEQDLFLRDFSINTLSIGLEEFLEGPVSVNSFIDLYGAKEDLKSRIIRVVNKKAFSDDPLRILRAFSLSSIFSFEIEKSTLELIKLKKNKLSTVSFERIRDELFKILKQPHVYKYLKMLDDLKVLSVIMPEIECMRGVRQGPYHHLNVLDHSFEAVRQLEIALDENKNKEINAYLDEPISAERTRGAILKLAAFLHDIGKPKAKRRRAGKTMFHGHEKIGSDMALEIAKRFKLSNNEIAALRKMVFWHLRPGYLADNEEITPRAIFRYFRDTSLEGASTLLLSIADQRATKGRLTSEESRKTHEKVVFRLIKTYFKKQKEKKLPRLITGHDLIKKFKLEPSPLIGKILAQIEELQAVGEIKTKEEAFKKVRQIILSNKDERTQK